jgi:hypothetical protein
MDDSEIYTIIYIKGRNLEQNSHQVLEFLRITPSVYKIYLSDSPCLALFTEIYATILYSAEKRICPLLSQIELGGII